MCCSVNIEFIVILLPNLGFIFGVLIKRITEFVL